MKVQQGPALPGLHVRVQVLSTGDSRGTTWSPPTASLEDICSERILDLQRFPLSSEGREVASGSVQMFFITY